MPRPAATQFRRSGRYRAIEQAHLVGGASLGPRDGDGAFVPSRQKVLLTPASAFIVAQERHFGWVPKVGARTIAARHPISSFYRASGLFASTSLPIGPFDFLIENRVLEHGLLRAEG